MSGPMGDLSPRTLGHIRTAVTLAVLALLLVFGVNRGLKAVSEPFPESVDPPICTDQKLVSGDVLRPSQLVVSVINAGKRTGLAGSTLKDLEDQGFVRGRTSTVTNADVKTVEIWTTDGKSAATRLVAGYLSGKVKVVQREDASEGITVIVGDQFTGVRGGQKQIALKEDLTICAPPDLA